MTYEKSTVDNWSDAQVALLRLGADIVGDADNCLLARFVLGKTCRGDADYTAGARWSERGLSHVQPPHKDVNLDAAARDSSTLLTGAGAAAARGWQQTHTCLNSPPLSLGAFYSTARTTNCPISGRQVTRRPETGASGGGPTVEYVMVGP